MRGLMYESVARQCDGGFEEVGPGKLAMCFVRFRSQRDIARNADTQPALHRIAKRGQLAILVEKPVGRCTCRSRLAAVISRDIAIRLAPHEEAAAADARALRFDHRQCQHHGNRRIRGRATLRQYSLARLLGTRVGSADSSPDGIGFCLDSGILQRRAPGKGEARATRQRGNLQHGTRAIRFRPPRQSWKSRRVSSAAPARA